MKKIIYIVATTLFISLIFIACDTTKTYLRQQGPGLYASICMESGEIIFIELYYQETPITVMNFAGLASGKFSDNIDRKGNFYDGLTIHRVEPNFVIQGGDPEGNGRGGPGYSFVDEFNDTLLHDDVGILSMANSGLNTNGSQFFITLKETSFLDGKHTVFGKVLEGLEILETISPGDVITSVTIYAKGKEAKTFFNNISYEDFQDKNNAAIENQKQIQAEKKQKELDELDNNTDFIKTPQGIYYQILQAGSGRKNKDGDVVNTHYKLSVYGNETVIDDSTRREQPFPVTIGARQVIPGWEIILRSLRVGDQARVIIPPELAYGERGAGNGIIPPDAFLDFTITVVDRQ